MRLWRVKHCSAMTCVSRLMLQRTVRQWPCVPPSPLPQRFDLSSARFAGASAGAITCALGAVTPTCTAPRPPALPPAALALNHKSVHIYQPPPLPPPPAACSCDVGAAFSSAEDIAEKEALHRRGTWALLGVRVHSPLWFHPLALLRRLNSATEIPCYYSGLGPHDPRVA
jgi:hypothetical protein